MDRPFYGEFAWAFDLLIDRPVQKDCAAIVTWLIERGVLPASRVLDAGCGTGRYAAELSRRGYFVHGIDAVPEMLEQAMQHVPNSRMLSFSVASLPLADTSIYDAILCRGVLNDILDPTVRKNIFPSFARCLRDGGVLLFDVREWTASVQRKTREPLFRKRVESAKGLLTFTSVTSLDHEARQLRIAEEHVLTTDGQERSAPYEFAMQCWTIDEVMSWLLESGFSSIKMFGAYDEGIAVGATDRLVVVASR